MRNFYNIPNYWIWVKHHKIAKINAKNSLENLNDNDKVTFLPMSLVEVISGKYSLSETRELGKVKKGYTAFSNGDILFAKITPTMENGKIAIMNNLLNGVGYGSTEFHVSKVYSGIKREYLFYYFTQSLFRNTAKKFMTGSAGQLRVPTDYFKNVEIPLSPFLEQKAIVAKIEQLFSELDNGIQNLKTAQQKLKIYGQAVLKKAFEGELTQEWREKQTNLPTADELLEKIKEEREKHYQKQLKEWEESVKKWESDGKNGKKPSKPRKKELGDIFKKDNLPNGWIYCPIKNLGLIATGATPLRSNSDYWTNGTIPWIKSGTLNSTFIKKADEFTTIKALEETNIKLFPKHTLVIALYGEGKTRGLCSELLIETTTNQAIAGIIQTGLEEKTRAYLKHFLLKNYQNVRRKSSGGVQPNLNSDIVKNTLVPLCSLEEQTQIVQEIESRLSVCDNIEATITDALKKAEALRQSILKKAFEGKLLTAKELDKIKKNPEYESVEKLLQRIKKEKVNG